jgi:hypothetical protein
MTLGHRRGAEMILDTRRRWLYTLFIILSLSRVYLTRCLIGLSLSVGSMAMDTAFCLELDRAMQRIIEVHIWGVETLPARRRYP